MHFFPYLNQHDVIVKWPRFVIIMSDDDRDWERLLEALRGVDAVLSQDHLHHAAPEGAQNRTGGIQIRYSGKYFDATWQKAIFVGLLTGIHKWIWALKMQLLTVSSSGRQTPPTGDGWGCLRRSGDPWREGRLGAGWSKAPPLFPRWFASPAQLRANWGVR